MNGPAGRDAITSAFRRSPRGPRAAISGLNSCVSACVRCLRCGCARLPCSSYLAPRSSSGQAQDEGTRATRQNGSTQQSVSRKTLLCGGLRSSCRCSTFRPPHYGTLVWKFYIASQGNAISTDDYDLFVIFTFSPFPLLSSTLFHRHCARRCRNAGTKTRARATSSGPSTRDKGNRCSPEGRRHS